MHFGIMRYLNLVGSQEKSGIIRLLEHCDRSAMHRLIGECLSRRRRPLFGDDSRLCEQDNRAERFRAIQ